MMEFLKNYKYKQLEDGCVVLDLVPVEDFPEISVCVNPNAEYVAIFDGGSTFASLKMLYNFSSKQVLDKLVEICKTHKVSKKGKVLFLECTKQNFETRLNDFVAALNEICGI